MALVRILVDGYSLLHAWVELAPGKPSYSATPRKDQINRLPHYHDASGPPLPLSFDGATPNHTPSPSPSTAKVKIISSRPGQTADQLIERVAHRLTAYGEVLV